MMLSYPVNIVEDDNNTFLVKPGEMRLDRITDSLYTVHTEVACPSKLYHFLS